MLRCLPALLLAAVLPAATPTKTVHSPVVKASLTCPADWIDKGTAATDLLNPDFKGAYNASGWGPAMDGEVLIAVNPSKPMTAEELMKAMRASFAGIDPSLASMPITLKPVTIGGLAGFDLDYGKGGPFGESRVVVLFAKGNRYTLSAMGFDERPGEFAQYAPAVDTVFRSFRLDP